MASNCVFLGWVRGAGIITGLLVAAPSRAYSDMPALSFDGAASTADLIPAYDLALKNLIDINTDTFDSSLDKTGLIPASAHIVSPGSGYKGQIWTRDAAVNSLSAASLLEPGVAASTLWAACTRQSNGKLIVNQTDGQFWDRSVWISGAWQQYVVTGDRTFLTNAYEAASESLKAAERDYLDAEFGLFRGPSHINDGVSAYPAPPVSDPETGSGSFGYADVLKTMALSSNVVHYDAYQDAARMADALGKPATEAAALRTKAVALKVAINAKLWLSSAGRYGYFVHGAGALRGQVDPSQESLGLALAISSGVASAEQIASINSHVAIAPRGIPDIYPHFARYDNGHPGRHNVSVWPYIQGAWAYAMAFVGNEAQFSLEVARLAHLPVSAARPSDRQFYEIYHFQTGLYDGGWQTGGSWGSAPNQTWSATGFLRAIYGGLFGMRFEASDLRFAPVLPTGWGPATLTGVHYRDMVLDIVLRGAGNHVASFVLDGKVVNDAIVPGDLSGPHRVEITLSGAFSNLARAASVSSSPTSPDYPGTQGINDGKVNGYLDNATPSPAFKGSAKASGLNLGDERQSEWVAASTSGNRAWVQLDWPSAQAIRKVRLFDRINSTDHVTGGTLSFSDGSSLPVGELPNDGFSAAEVSFEPKLVRSVRFTIASTSPATFEPGLAELEVYGEPAADVTATGEGGAAGSSGAEASGAGGSGQASGGTLTSSGNAGTSESGAGSSSHAGGSSEAAPRGGCGCALARSPKTERAVLGLLALVGVGVFRRRRGTRAS